MLEPIQDNDNYKPHAKVIFNLFFKPVVSGWFGRLHNHILFILFRPIYYSLLSPHDSGEGI
jgi:hypothetical protein